MVVRAYEILEREAIHAVAQLEVSASVVKSSVGMPGFHSSILSGIKANLNQHVEWRR